LELTLKQRIQKAKPCFDVGGSPDLLFVTKDGLAFKRDADASAQAKALNGNPFDYFEFSRSIVTKLVSIDTCTIIGDVDLLVDGSSDPVLVEYANNKKAEIIEAARIAFKLDFLAHNIDLENPSHLDRLDMLEYGETDSTVLAQIESYRQTLLNL
jgi:hypothetical protein